MDSTALSFCMDNSLPIIVFDLAAPQSIERAVNGESRGTVVSSLETVLADQMGFPAPMREGC
jgi:uridylate kinase